MDIEEKRQALHDYCEGRSCDGCPLEEVTANECGYGPYFLARRENETEYYVTNEQAEKAYEIMEKEEERTWIPF